MRKKNLITTAIVTLIVAGIFTGCGKKEASNTDTNTETKVVAEQTTTKTQTKSTGEAVTENNTEATTEVESTTEEATETVIEVAVEDTQTNTNIEPAYEYVDIAPSDTENNDTGSNDSSSSDSGSSNTGNSFYDDFVNGSHTGSSESLIDKDSDPSKPCPYELNTPFETVYHGLYRGVEGDYPAYIVYTLCSEDPVGAKARRICYNMYGVDSMYRSLPIGEYDCGLVRATYIKKL